MSQASTNAPNTRHFRGNWLTEWLPFAVFLTLGFAAQMWRNSHESTIWRDEVYTMMLSSRPLPELIDLTSVDAHPPLYYFLSRAWLLLGNALGLEPGVVWMRSLNMVGWTAMATTLWFAGRRLFGRWPGAAGAIAAVAAGGLTEAFRNLRNYTFVCPAILGCAVILAFAVRRAMDDEKPETTARVAAVWTLYALLGLLALWMHLLSALALTALGVTWIAMSLATLRLRGWTLARGMIIGGGLAQMAIMVGFAPWLAVVARQLKYIASVELLWMTPPTLYNGLRVFAVWYPMGNVATFGLTGWEQSNVALALGLVAVLTIATAGLLAVLRPTALGSSLSRGTLMAVGVVLAVAVLNVAIQMLVTVLGISKTFHGLRYPIITAPVFALGIGGIAALAVARFRWPAWVSLLIVAPWLVACVYGNVWMVTREANRGVEGIRPFLQDATLQATKPLYLTPWALYPMHRHSLRGFDVRPLEDAFREPAAERLRVLNLNRVFYETDWVHERQELALLTANETCAGVRQWELPSGVREYLFYDVKAPQLDEIRARYAAARARLEHPGPPNAVVIAHAAQQRRADGWSSTAASPRGMITRWGQRFDSIVRFDAPLPAGRWRLIVRGFRLPIPKEVETLTLRIDGTETSFDYSLSPGPFELVSEFDYAGGAEPLALVMEHPLAEFKGAVDERRGIMFQSVRFDEAWVEPLPPPPASPPSGS